MPKKHGAYNENEKRKNDININNSSANRSLKNSRDKEREKEQNQNQLKGSSQSTTYQKNRGKARTGAYYNGMKNEKKQKAEETIEDIKADILRIEKEIKLEINEIRSLKLGL